MKNIFDTCSFYYEVGWEQRWMKLGLVVGRDDDPREGHDTCVAYGQLLSFVGESRQCKGQYDHGRGDPHIF